MAMCTLCHGHGKVIRRHPCPVCHDHKKVREACHNCGGKAWIETFPIEVKCQECDAMGVAEYDCKHCGGSGGVPVEETCSDCHGSGTLPD